MHVTLGHAGGAASPKLANRAVEQCRSCSEGAGSACTDEAPLVDMCQERKTA